MLASSKHNLLQHKLVDNIVNRLSPISVKLEFFNIQSAFLNIGNIYICEITICTVLLPIHYQKIYKKNFRKAIQYASTYYLITSLVYIKYPRKKSRKLKHSITVLCVNLSEDVTTTSHVKRSDVLRNLRT